MSIPTGPAVHRVLISPSRAVCTLQTLLDRPPGAGPPHHLLECGRLQRLADAGGRLGRRLHIAPYRRDQPARQLHPRLLLQPFARGPRPRAACLPGRLGPLCQHSLAPLAEAAPARLLSAERKHIGQALFCPPQSQAAVPLPYPSSPVPQPNGLPASSARSRIRRTSADLVAHWSASGHARRAATLLLVSPLLGQVQCTGKANPPLAVFMPSSRAAVLALHANAFRPLFEKASLIGRIPVIPAAQSSAKLVLGHC
jgi:hypothetical protein